jgi:hypothetical protein
VAAIQPTIWSARLRSYNAVGNPTFEVDQRNVGVAITPGNNVFAQDRWRIITAGTMAFATRQVASGNVLVIPGTSFRISGNFLSCNLTTQETSLAAGDYWAIQQFIEGPMARELVNDVSSVSILVSSSVAPLKFGLVLRDSTPAYAITKLCTITTPNTWTLIQLPNIPVFPSGGSFPITPGNNGYQLIITLACGSTFTAPANDVWQTSGAYFGAVGQDNFASKAVNSTVNIAFIQHEPGPICTTLIDKPFQQNYDECLRYFCKSYPYGTKPPSPSIQAGLRSMTCVPSGTNYMAGPVTFPKSMAKTPSTSIYAYDGTLNAVTIIGGANAAVTGVGGNMGDLSFDSLTLSAAGTANTVYQFHYAADTGW